MEIAKRKKVTKRKWLMWFAFCEREMSYQWNWYGKRKRRLRQSANGMADDNQEKFNQETINKQKT